MFKMSDQLMFLKTREPGDYRLIEALMEYVLPERLFVAIACLVSVPIPNQDHDSVELTDALRSFGFTEFGLTFWMASNSSMFSVVADIKATAEGIAKRFTKGADQAPFLSLAKTCGDTLDLMTTLRDGDPYNEVLWGTIASKAMFAHLFPIGLALVAQRHPLAATVVDAISSSSRNSVEHMRKFNCHLGPNKECPMHRGVAAQVTGDRPSDPDYLTDEIDEPSEPNQS